MQTIRLAVLASFIIVCFVAGGCGNESSSSSATDSHAADNTESPSTAAAKIPLDYKNWNELQEWIASQSGRVVVIDVWSTFCAPCLREFPAFVQLHEARGEQVSCASFNVDFYGGEGNRVEDVQPQVLNILESQNATMQNFISTEPDEAILKQIGTSAVPAVLVYGRDGTLRKVFRNDQNEYGPEGFSYEKDIEALIGQMLNSDQPAS